jgi:hypothetical protein
MHSCPVYLTYLPDLFEEIAEFLNMCDTLI